MNLKSNDNRYDRFETYNSNNPCYHAFKRNEAIKGIFYDDVITRHIIKKLRKEKKNLNSKLKNILGFLSFILWCCTVFISFELFAFTFLFLIGTLSTFSSFLRLKRRGLL